MSDKKVVYLSRVLQPKADQDDGIAGDSLTLISTFMEIRSPEKRQAVIDFCEKIARGEKARGE